MLILVVVAAAGGAGIYGIIEATKGSGGLDLSNATVGNLEYDARSKNAIIDLDFDFRNLGMVMEIGIIALVSVLSFLCFCYACCRRDARMTHSMCYHPDDENRWRSQRIAKRERN